MSRPADLIITGAHVGTADSEFDATLVVADGRIVAIEDPGSPLPRAIETIDARGRVVIPGAIDTHCHFNEPGRTEREGFASGTAAAASAGVTTVFDHPNTDPPVATVERFEHKRRLAERNAVIDFGLWGALLPGSASSIAPLHSAGAVAFKAFMTSINPGYPMVSDAELLDGLAVAAECDAIVGVHAESHALVSHLTERLHGTRGWDNVLATRPKVAELEAVARAVCLASAVGARLHVVHVSSADIVALARQLASRDLISVETCPHYLTFDASQMAEQGAFLKCKPPLRSRDDVDSLWGSLTDEEIDFVASDHAPYLLEEKNRADEWAAPWGVPSLEMLLPTVVDGGLIQRGWNLSKIVRLTSTNAARRFGIERQKGAIAVGTDGDLVILDLTANRMVVKEDIVSRCGWSPWVGRTVKGRVETTISRGEIVYRAGQVVGRPGRGRFVHRELGRDGSDSRPQRAN